MTNQLRRLLQWAILLTEGHLQLDESSLSEDPFYLYHLEVDNRVSSVAGTGLQVTLHRASHSSLPLLYFRSKSLLQEVRKGTSTTLYPKV